MAHAHPGLFVPLTSHPGLALPFTHSLMLGQRLEDFPAWTTSLPPEGLMFLAYVIQPLDGERVTAYVFATDGRQGGPLGPDRFPHQPANLLRTPPPALALQADDRRILMSLVMYQKLGGTKILFAGESAFKIISAMVATGRCYLAPGTTAPLKWGKAVAMTPTWAATPGDDRLKPTFQRAEGLTLLPSTPPLVIDTHRASCRPVKSAFPDALATLWLRSPSMDPVACIRFLERLMAQHPHAALPAPPHLDEQYVEDAMPTPVLTVFRQSGQTEAALLVRLTYRYGQREISAFQDGERVRFVDGNVLVDMARQTAVEAAARQRLADSGFTPHLSPAADLFTHAVEVEAFALPTDGSVTWTDAVQTLFPALTTEGWEIRHAEGCHLVTAPPEDWYADFTATAHGWLAFESGVRVGEQRINLLPFLHRYLREHRNWTEQELAARLEGASIPVVTPTCIVLIAGERLLRMIHQLFELFSKHPLDKQDRLRVNAWRAAELALDTPGVAWDPPPELAQLVRSLTAALHIAPLPAPDGMAAELRPYQAYGLGWLEFLRTHRLGGILADDMGLGKTIQAIALLQQEKRAGRLDLPVLVVAPTSVLPNWRRELERFAPELRLRILHGPERHTEIDGVADADVLITTYALLRRDTAFYADRRFGIVLLDEAQAIKNPKAQVAQAAFALQSRMRLCLTGTPIENHLGELWSLMHFAAPGLLGSEQMFKDNFQNPIEQDNHPLARRQLQRRIKPLLLRRTKDAVATELPPKNEIVQTVPLSDAQADLYQAVRMAIFERVRAEMAAKGMARSRIVILDALLKLRQICCDPRLRDAERDYALPGDSCKLQWLTDTLPEMVEEGRRILLFSQFTSMLDLIKPQLAALKLDFVEIRGSTRDRETPVRDFQAGQAPIFLISLKAGGQGLNLTAADTVIHYDPWWNPAVEAQATDRAHRIGQDKPVFVYKLVTEGTVEERILELQARKRALTKLVEGVKGENLAFTPEDLDALLAPLATRRCQFT
jgi:superfamily II DNA or RNA helicase